MWAKRDYENLVKNIPGAVYSVLLDEKGTIVFASGRLGEWTGYSPADFYKDPGVRVRSIHPEDRDKASEVYAEACRKKDAYVSEYRVVHKDTGEIRYLSDHGVPVRDDEGGIIRFDGIVTDITKHKRAEEAMEKSEARIRALLNAPTDAMILIDSEGIVLALNESHAEKLGKGVDEIVGKCIYDFFPPDIAKFRKAQADKTFSTGKPIRFEESQEGRTYDTHDYPVFDAGGKVTAVAVYARDITERVRVEEALRESEGRFRAIFETAQDSIFIKDRTLKYTQVNPAMERLFGLPASKLIGLADKDLFPEEAASHIREVDSRVLGGEIIEEEYTKPVKEVPHTFHIIKVPMCDSSGEIIGLCGIARDITERKKAEEELRHYSEHLEELVEERTYSLKEAERMAAIGETTIMVGHDLRNPLQAIVNNIYLAKKKATSLHIPEEELKVKQRLQDSLDTIEERVGYMNKIVLDLQDYARPVKPKLVKTNMKKLIDDAISTIEIPETVKTSTKIEKLGELLVDPELLRRTITNLVTNAVQAMSRGGRLTITLRRKDQDVLISVRDTGVGISEENIGKIFNPLFTTKSQGQGFGLSVCKRLVEAHGGSLLVESEVGKGSIFTVRIPLVVG